MYLLDCLGKFLGLETTRTFSFLRILKTKYQGHICFIAESGSSKIKGSFTLHRTLLRADLYSVPSKHMEEQLGSLHSRSITYGPLWMAFQCHFPPFPGIYLRLLHGFLPYSLSLSLLRNHTYHKNKHFSQFLLFYKLFLTHNSNITSTGSPCRSSNHNMGWSTGTGISYINLRQYKWVENKKGWEEPRLI